MRNRAETTYGVFCSNSSTISVTLQNFQDSEAEKAIMGSIVYCIHHKDGCKWSDELRKLKVYNII